VKVTHPCSPNVRLHADLQVLQQLALLAPDAWRQHMVTAREMLAYILKRNRAEEEEATAAASGSPSAAHGNPTR
jgi:hypothetical protein